MRGVGFASIVLVAVSAGAAHGESFDAPDWARDWHRRMEALAQSLTQSLGQSMTGERLPDHEIIKPRGNIDPKMVLVPRQPMAPMRTIIPPGQPGRGL